MVTESGCTRTRGRTIGHHGGRIIIHVLAGLAQCVGQYEHGSPKRIGRPRLDSLVEGAGGVHVVQAGKNL
jgi:hypothetical protein